MLKTKFNANETKALLTKYYELYEGKKLESVAIIPRILPTDDFVKSFEASTVFVVKFFEEIEGFKKESEEYLEIADVCGYLSKLFEGLGYRELMVSVRSKMDDAYWAKEADEESRIARFDGVVFEYEYKETIDAKTTEVDEAQPVKSTSTKTTKTTKSTKSSSASLKKTRGK